MKRLIFIAILSLFFVNVFATEIDLTKTPQPLPPYPRVMTTGFSVSSVTDFLVVSAIISETQLSVYFETSVGDAIITVYDSTNQVVYQETVDTETTSSVFVPTDSWSAGDYTITISYDTTELTGYFVIE